MIYTFMNGSPIKDSLLAELHLKVLYDQVNVNVHQNKSEVRFQNKRLIYGIVTKRAN
ncbi:MAG: hypothetical protein ACR5K2_05010 [Wolbachia sp.]